MWSNKVLNESVRRTEKKDVNWKNQTENKEQFGIYQFKWIKYFAMKRLRSSDWIYKTHTLNMYYLQGTHLK